MTTNFQILFRFFVTICNSLIARPLICIFAYGIGFTASITLWIISWTVRLGVTPLMQILLDTIGPSSTTTTTKKESFMKTSCSSSSTVSATNTTSTYLESSILVLTFLSSSQSVHALRTKPLEYCTDITTNICRTFPFPSWNHGRIAKSMAAVVIPSLIAMALLVITAPQNRTFAVRELEIITAIDCQIANSQIIGNTMTQATSQFLSPLDRYDELCSHVLSISSRGNNLFLWEENKFFKLFSQKIKSTPYTAVNRNKYGLKMKR